MRRIVIPACLALASFGAASALGDEAAIRAAVMKSLPLLERSSMTAIEERPNCFTCHHTGLPVMTFVAARERGLAVNEKNLRTQVGFTAAFLTRNRENYLKGKGQGGQAFTAGSALWALDLGGHQRDATTDSVIEYLLSHQKDLGHWKPPSVRPPSEESAFSTSFFALAGLKAFGNGAQRERTERALASLLKTPATSTEDRVFKVWSLAIAEAEHGQLKQATQELLRTQRADGGWAQLDDMDSDAYATGTALVALHRGSGLATNDPAYRRGVQWLLQAQLADGSWHVRSRAKPFQSYFESGYPHGKDQFISITAACWATTALILTLPVSP